MKLSSVASDEDSKFREMGTLGWRLGIYEEIFERLGKRDFVQVFFGSGTSSGAALMLDHDSQYV